MGGERGRRRPRDGDRGGARRGRPAGAGQRRIPAFFTVEERERLVADKVYREERFLEAILEVMRAWADLAVERLQPLGIECVINLGNDDDPEVARALRESSWVRFAEDDVYDLNGVEVVSWGWSNRTPWNSPREQDEDELEASIMAAAAKARDPEHAIFNLHCPPYNSGLDIAPAVTDDFKVQTRGGTPMTIPVGSTAVRSVIERVQPLVGLHGHVHDRAEHQARPDALHQPRERLPARNPAGGDPQHQERQGQGLDDVERLSRRRRRATAHPTEGRTHVKLYSFKCGGDYADRALQDPLDAEVDQALRAVDGLRRRSPAGPRPLRHRDPARDPD